MKSGLLAERASAMPMLTSLEAKAERGRCSGRRTEFKDTLSTLGRRMQHMAKLQLF